MPAGQQAVQPGQDVQGHGQEAEQVMPEPEPIRSGRFPLWQLVWHEGLQQLVDPPPGTIPNKVSLPRPVRPLPRPEEAKPDQSKLDKSKRGLTPNELQMAKILLKKNPGIFKGNPEEMTREEFNSILGQFRRKGGFR